jgi:hypothetical protein
MKKTIYLLSIAFLICFEGIAQNMTIPAPNTPNTLFLKYSISLNGEAYVPKVNISEYPETRDYKPVYLFFSDGVMNASLSIIRNYFYAIDPEECAYIDPALYNSVSLSREQLEVLVPKLRKTTMGNLKHLGKIHNERSSLY